MEGDIQPFGGHINRAVRQAQAHINLRIKVFESRDMRRNEPPPDAQGGRDKDRAARVLRDVHHRGFGVVNRLQHLARAVIENPAILGRLQGPGGARKQPDAEMLFQL